MRTAPVATRIGVMQPSEQLAAFVHEGLKSGHDPHAIGTALRAGGWSEREVSEALSGWLPAQPGLDRLPVPRPRPYVSARDAVLYGLLFIALGNVAWGIGSLGLQVIDGLIADPADFYRGRSYSSQWSIASLIVFTPVFLVLNHRVMRRTVADGGRSRSLVRKWFASITVIIATLTLLGDAVTVIYAFLSGDLTLRFLAKAVWVAILAAVVLTYLRDEIDVG